MKVEDYLHTADQTPTGTKMAWDEGLDGVHEMFEAQAERTPDARAIVFEGASITYGELNKRANQLARRLQLQGLNPESLCGVCVERSIDMLVSVLGILKTGAAYVPLDATYPQERLAFMLEDARMPVLLVDHRTAERLETVRAGDTKLLLVDAELQSSARHKEDNPGIKAAADHPAYVIFTSGSTGRPKGVVMGHGALMNLLRWQVESSRLAGDPRKTVQFASLSFDVSFQEIFSTWCVGGTLVLIRDEIRRDVRQLWELLMSQQIERLFLPPVVLQRLAEVADKQMAAPTQLREIIVAGEQLKITPQIRRMFEQLPGCTLHNQYGPSESHVVTSYRLSGDPATWMELPPIGRPITNAQIHILDEHLLKVETGTAGELHIGGVCLARGYLNRPELTAERFINNPFQSSAVSAASRESELAPRLYRTGDLARRLPDGNIEFLGRLDHQIKVRGYRVETSEIEAALLGHPAIREAFVTAYEDARGVRRLVAYLGGNGQSAQTEPSVSELRDFLSRKLPEYMIPSVFMHLSTLPLTTNGKVDRAALPAPDDRRPDLRQAIAPPANAVEERLQKIWERVLNVSPVGVKDNFFDLGGDSLNAVEMLIELKEAFGKNLSASILLGEGTIERLAQEIIAPGAEKEWSALVPIQPEGKRPPLFFAHAIGGEVYSYKELAGHLGRDQPFYGLQARGLDGEQTPFRNMRKMAEHYLEEVLRIQPQEPYLLGGYSLGGIIAFEMAQQLYARGYRQIQVMILDEEAPVEPPPVFRSAINVARNIPHWFVHHVARRPESELRESVRRNLTKLTRRARRVLRTVEESPPEAAEAGLAGVLDIRQLPPTHRKVSAALYEALMSYRPQVYPGSLTLFRTRAQPLVSVFGLDKGWKRLVAGGVEIKIVGGNHLDMYEGPNAQALAREIEAFLERKL